VDDAPSGSCSRVSSGLNFVAGSERRRLRSGMSFGLGSSSPVKREGVQRRWRRGVELTPAAWSAGGGGFSSLALTVFATDPDRDTNRSTVLSHASR
jgi:hypothetical protein